MIITTHYIFIINSIIPNIVSNFFIKFVITKNYIIILFINLQTKIETNIKLKNIRFFIKFNFK